MRSFFKTCKVHHCFSQELNEKQPKKCKCRKLISKDTASKFVEDGIADWLIDYSGEVPIPSWDIILKGRAGKTPRSQTIEKAHIERYVDAIWNADLDDPEVLRHLEIYHDIEIEERIKMFTPVRTTLLELKKESDTCGDVQGEAGRVLVDKIIQAADVVKNTVAKDDPFKGRAWFMPLGGDQRTNYSKK